MNRAVFLDRDGTLVHPRHYPSKPEDLVLYDGVAPELRTLQRAGYRLVLITNQSGIARGLFTETDLQRMHDSLQRELAGHGVHLDAIEYCPHHEDGIIPELAVRCGCRKPAPGMLLRAADRLAIDLAQSWFLGDILDDVEAGNRAGCRTILVDIGTESLPTADVREPEYVARDIVHALRIVQTEDGLGLAVDCDYRPPGWRRDNALAG